VFNTRLQPPVRTLQFQTACLYCCFPVTRLVFHRFPAWAVFALWIPLETVRNYKEPAVFCLCLNRYEASFLTASESSNRNNSACFLHFPQLPQASTSTTVSSQIDLYSEGTR